MDAYISEKRKKTRAAEIKKEEQTNEKPALKPEAPAEPFESARRELYDAEELKRRFDESSDIKGLFLFKEDGAELAKEYEQQSLPKEVFLSERAYPYFKLIGQVFGTYWIIEYDGYMYLIDQHAAHEKVNYEHLMKQVRERTVGSQYISPPVLLHLRANEAVAVMEDLSVFEELGYELEGAGGNDIIVRAVPANLPELSKKDLLMEVIDSLSEEFRHKNAAGSLRDKLASMSCKAAVKGNSRLSEPEMRALIGELLTLNDPYACPHGRPTIVRWSRYELDKLFKRIV